MINLGIEETISCSTSNHVYHDPLAFMSHILDHGTGLYGSIDLYHYLTACYMFQLYGNKIGDSAVNVFKGIKKEKSEETIKIYYFYSKSTSEIQKRSFSCK